MVNKDQISQDAQKLCKIPQIQKFMQMHHLQATFLDENIIEFITWAEELKKCQGCKGLAFCRQRITGSVYHLGIDDAGYIEERYIPCAYEKEKEQRLEHRKNYRISDMNEADYLIDLQDCVADKTISSKKEYMEALRLVLASENCQHGLYLYGQPGVGKSFLLKALCNHYAKKGLRVSFVKVPNWMQTLKESFGDDQVRREINRSLRNSDVVVFDDIGSEAASAWTLNEILFPILDYRMEQKKKTYFTSNYSPKELAHKYALIDKGDQVGADRIMDRVYSLSQAVLLSGSSLR